MKILSIILFTAFTVIHPVWFTDFDLAKKEAAGTQKNILISFSGSDWCVHCIRMEEELWSNPEFKQFASEKLVLVQADFPRLKKNQLDKIQVRRNEKLSDLYNPKGTFPHTVLVDANGKLLKSWEGFPKMSVKDFTEQVSRIIDANRHANQ